MYIKRKLGIDTFPVKEEEVTRKICDAYHNQEEQLVLEAGNCVLKIGMDRVLEEENLDC